MSLKLLAKRLIPALVLVAAGVSTGATAQTLTFLTPPWGVPPDSALLDAFEAEHGVDVEIRSLPLDQIYSRVQTAGAARRAPADVIFLAGDAPSNIVARGHLDPLAPYLDETEDLNLDDISRADQWTYQDQLVGLTTYVQIVMMDYNQERLAQAGFAEPPATWDELESMASAIKEQGIDEYPISFSSWWLSWVILSLSLGDELFDDQLEPVFTNPESPAREAMTRLAQYFESGLITPDMLGQAQPHALFQSGVGTFHQSWQGADAVMNNPAVSTQAPNVRYMLIPGTHNTVSNDAGIGISRFSQNKDLAWEFVKWYLGEENQLAIFRANGLVPSRKSVQHQIQEQNLSRQFELQQQQAEYVVAIPKNTPMWGPWASFVTETTLRVFGGQVSPDEAIDQMAERWNELKSEYE